MPSATVIFLKTAKEKDQTCSFAVCKSVRYKFALFVCGDVVSNAADYVTNGLRCVVNVPFRLLFCNKTN